MPHSLLLTSRRWGWLTLVLVLLMDSVGAGLVQAQRFNAPLTATVGADSSSPASPPGPPINSDSAFLINQAPTFPGGEAALLRFIRERIRYPSLAMRNHVEGKVIVSFWLDERGRPYGFGIWKGLGAGLDEEALRILREMPDWAPAIINGHAALMQLRIPVVFRLAP